MKKANVSMIRGDTMIFYFTVDCDQSPDFISFAAAKNTCGDYIFNKTLGDGIERLPLNSFRINVFPEDTSNAEIGDYLYNFRVGINGDVFTFLYGTLTLLPDKIYSEEK